MTKVKEMNQKYTLSKSNIIILLIVCVIQCISLYISIKYNSSITPVIVGGLIGSVLLPLLISYIVWVSNKDLKKARITFNVILIVAFVVAKNQTKIFSKQNSADYQSIIRIVNKFKEKQQLYPDSSDAYYTQLVYDLNTIFKSLKNNKSGKEKQAIEFIHQFMNDVAEANFQWLEAINNMDTTILHPSLMKDSSEVYRQRKVINNYIYQTEALKEVFEKKMALTKESNFDTPFYQGFAEQIEKESSDINKYLIPSILAHLEYGRIHLEMLEFLSSVQSKWEYTNGELIFDTDELVNTYNSMFMRTTELSNQINQMAGVLN